jgi:hypothetical protein
LEIVIILGAGILAFLAVEVAKWIFIKKFQIPNHK